MAVTRALELIASAAAGRECTLVGIGGRGTSGKTTLARAIRNAQIVPTDSFWDGEGFDLLRVRREVIEPLLHGETARYGAYDWARGMPAGERVVEPHGIVVIEGVCALHRLLRDAYAVRIWVEAPRAVRLERAVARDGAGSRAEWEERWLPSEDEYVERDDPASSAHVLVDGSGLRAIDGGWSAGS